MCFFLIHFSKHKYPVTFLRVSSPVFDRFIPGNEEKTASTAASHCFIFQGSGLLVAKNDGAIRVPLIQDIESFGITTPRAHYLGSVAENPCRAVEVPSDIMAPNGWSFEAVRSLFGRISDGFFSVAARALEVLEWDRTHRYCGTCGVATTLKDGERARECPSCGQLSYPRISPAVIMAVVRDERILLARARRFAPGLYSVLAGFVEPGESLEECVAREVREETGVEVKNLRYFGSQPWPFPHSLMIAFTAEYAGGEILIDESELADAGWYAADALPSIPDPITVARRLIDWFTASARARGAQ
jgi:NAD+ diphosphatase